MSISQRSMTLLVPRPRLRQSSVGCLLLRRLTADLIMVLRPFLAHLFPSPLRARKAAFKPKADAERTLPGLVLLTLAA
jgi:hypothetical protein